jgi:hydroxymethylbilane synthase
MTQTNRPLRLGTRGSPLALAQAHLVRDALIAAHAGIDIEIVPVVATGDKILDRPLAEVGGKALWTKELDAWLLSGDIDAAVHSMKDVETIRPDRIAIAAMLPRADVRDRIVGAESLAALPPGARIGTSAPRRTAQIKRLRPDLEVVLLRGNVNTRLAKIEAGEADATLLAAAGLDRLGMADVGYAIDVEDWLPAPQQGAIGIETLASTQDVRKLIAAIGHAETQRCVVAERTFLAGLNGGCRSPVAALATMVDGYISLRAEILSEDGQLSHSGAAMFGPDKMEAPRALALSMLQDAGPALRAHFG